MANIKFSQFTADGNIDGSSVTAKTGSETSFLVGYDTTGNTNNMWTFPQVAEGLNAHIPTIYTADSNVTSNRTIGLLSSNYLKIQDSSNVDLLSISEDGSFALGQNTTVNNNSNVAIGRDANVGGSNNIGIGRQVVLTSGNPSYAIALGYGASTGSTGVTLGSSIGSTESIAIGHSVSSGQGSVCVGYNSGQNFAGTLEGDNMICIGKNANYSSGVDNSIVLNASGSTTDAAVNTSNTFSVHMSSNTTPDFKVVGGGESVLNTSFKVTGQAYSELHAASSVDANWNDGNVQEVTLANSDQDFDPNNPKAGATYILKLTQPASGAAGTVNWNASSATVYWPGGTAPTLTATNGAVDIVTLICTSELNSGGSSGGTYYANVTLNFS